jgi:hypothetical protein
MSTPYLNAVLADAPVVLWRVNGTDASGNGNTGTIFGTIQFHNTGGPLVGQTSGYVQVEGAGRIAATLSSALNDYPNGRTTFSLECWVQFTSTTANLPQLMGWAADTLLFGANEELAGSINLQVNDAAQDAAGSSPLNDGAWHYLVGVYTGSTVLLYVDGVLVDTEPATAMVNTSGDQYSICGAGGANYTGKIAEAAVYPQALSQTRITAHYLAGTTAPPASGGKRAQNWWLNEE